MSSQTYPLSLPAELLEELRTLAAEAGLSVADVLRQAAKLGLPELRAKLCPAKRLQVFTCEYKTLFAMVAAEDVQQAGQIFVKEHKTVKEGAVLAPLKQLSAEGTPRELCAFLLGAQLK